MQKAVGILTGFRQKYLRTARSYISSDRLQNSAHRYRRILFICQKNMGKHRCGGRLSMSTRHCNGHVIVRHHLSQKFRPAQHRKSSSYSLLILLIILMDCRRIYYSVNSFYNIRCLLSIKYRSSQLLQMLCKRRLL